MQNSLLNYDATLDILIVGESDVLFRGDFISHISVDPNNPTLEIIARSVFTCCLSQQGIMGTPDLLLGDLL